MTQPSVDITELDGALGVTSTGNDLYALIGAATSGPFNTPATFARSQDVIAAFGAGELVEAAAHYIETYSRPVLLIRAEASADGSVSSITHTGTGTSVGSVSTPDPADAYEVKVKVVNGGTRGTAGITYQISLDGGRSYGTVKALGTATSITVAPGVVLDLAAGTLVAGDIYSFTTTGPTGLDYGAALDALAATSVQWRIVHALGAIDAGIFDTIETKFGALFGKGKYRAWIGGARIPNAGESESAYAAALDTALSSSKSTKFGSLVAGACKLPSSVTKTARYRRSASWAYAAVQASVSEEIDVAAPVYGALPGVAIRDVNGNPDEHDESLNPGLDDLRFVTLRTWDGYPGVYVNRPRLFSAAGSDFYLIPHRLVMNLGLAALRGYFIKRLGLPVVVNTKTGFILESEALEIEAGANATLAAVLLAKPKASGATFKLSRTDNILSTNKLTGQARITPLAYPETFDLSVGYSNPALQIIRAAA